MYPDAQLILGLSEYHQGMLFMADYMSEKVFYKKHRRRSKNLIISTQDETARHKLFSISFGLCPTNVSRNADGVKK
jgi:hypothetical protein